jgi:hypothetical protein
MSQNDEIVEQDSPLNRQGLRQTLREEVNGVKREALIIQHEQLPLKQRNTLTQDQTGSPSVEEPPTQTRGIQLHLVVTEVISQEGDHSPAEDLRPLELPISSIGTRLSSQRRSGPRE